MLSAERSKRLADMIQQERSLSVVRAAQLLGVSASTIRRDFEHLERLGLAERVHGGAIASPGSVDPASEPPRRARSSEHPAEKRRIGRAAAHLIAEGETVFIAGGTTTDAMLPYIGVIPRLTVVTNNLHTALGASRHSSGPIVVLGGYLRRDEQSLLGYLAAEALAHLSIDRAFYSAYAVGPTGLMGSQFEETETDRALLRAAGELVVLADHSKFLRTGPTRLALTSAIHTLVTDDGTAQEVRDELAAQGVHIITC